MLILEKKLLVPVIEKTNHEITIKDQVLKLHPPLEHARTNLIFQLSKWLEVVLGLATLQSARYDSTFTSDDSYLY